MRYLGLLTWIMFGILMLVMPHAPALIRALGIALIIGTWWSGVREARWVDAQQRQVRTD